MSFFSRLAALMMATLLAHGAYAMSTSDGSSSDNKPSYSEAERAVQDGQYEKAIDILKKVVADDSDNVDAYNYLGYSHRKLGRYDDARRYYRQALALNPEHRGANEYLGQLYLLQGDLSAAEAQLRKLERICGTGCEERDSLADAIAKYRQQNG